MRRTIGLIVLLLGALPTYADKKAQNPAPEIKNKPNLPLVKRGERVAYLNNLGEFLDQTTRLGDVVRTISDFDFNEIRKNIKDPVDLPRVEQLIRASIDLTQSSRQLSKDFETELHLNQNNSQKGRISGDENQQNARIYGLEALVKIAEKHFTESKRSDSFRNNWIAAALAVHDINNTTPLRAETQAYLKKYYLEKLETLKKGSEPNISSYQDFNSAMIVIAQTPPRFSLIAKSIKKTLTKESNALNRADELASQQVEVLNGEIGLKELRGTLLGFSETQLENLQSTKISCSNLRNFFSNLGKKSNKPGKQSENKPAGSTSADVTAYVKYNKLIQQQISEATSQINSLRNDKLSLKAKEALLKKIGLQLKEAARLYAEYSIVALPEKYNKGEKSRRFQGAALLELTKLRERVEDIQGQTLLCLKSNKKPIDDCENEATAPKAPPCVDDIKKINEKLQN